MPFFLSFVMNRAVGRYASVLRTCLLMSWALLAQQAMAQVIINEIYYDPEVQTEAVEFIELYNAGEVEADLSGWYFDEGITFTFPPATTLAANAYLVVAQDVAAVQAKFGVAALGPFVGRFSNEGERVTLRDGAGERVDRVDYKCGFPWPTASRGGGNSMELIHPAFDNDLGGNWRASGFGVVQDAPTDLVSIPLENAGFEQPALGKLFNFDTVPGWLVDSPSGDGGVDNTDNRALKTGEYFAFLMNGGDVLYQITTHTISARKKYTLTFEAWNGSGATLVQGYLVYLEDGGARQVITSAATPITAAFDSLQPNRLTLTFEAVAGAPYIGKILGIEIRNATFSSSWVELDEVRLGFSDPPEFITAQEQDWHYRKGISEPSETQGVWRGLEFEEDETWLTGQGAIGYGESSTIIKTELADMRNKYSTVYLRKSFHVSSPNYYSALTLGALYDDGINVWINGQHVLRKNVPGIEVPYTTTAGSADEDKTYRENPLPDPRSYLMEGTNVLSVQLVNASLGGSSDAFFDATLTGSFGEGGGSSAAPTPGARNSVYSETLPPRLRQVDHKPKQPEPGETVAITIKATDPLGVSSVRFSYQLVEPGSYIRLSDPSYETDWTNLDMYDDGTNGDEEAGDDVFTVLMPGALQTHRRLVRYRFLATNTVGFTVQAPYTDDAQPNFAYFVYGGVPAWRGAIEQNSSDATRRVVQEYTTETMRSLPIYHLISREDDVLNCQYNSSYNDKVYRWLGTMVYDGEVYDHIRYRIKGRASTYVSGKNKWKFNFNPGRPFLARDNYGEKYDGGWDKINFSTCMNAWWPEELRGASGMDEAIGHRLFSMASVPSPETVWFQLRVIDQAEESDPTDQYEGDFWGMYLALEQPDGRFLDRRGLPDGNLYKGPNIKTNQGLNHPGDNSDLNTFVSSSTGYNKDDPIQSQSWYETNVNLPAYYGYRAVSEGINNLDLRDKENCLYYHHTDGRWWMLAWDLDFIWADRLHNRGYFWENIRRCMAYPEIEIASKNRGREIRDLLLNDDQGGQLIDRYAALIARPGMPSFADANRAMWDYHPRTRNQGKFYYYGLLPSKTFNGEVTYMKQQISTSGFGGGRLDDQVADTSIPYTPYVTYRGQAGYPVIDLRFETSPFNDPQGSATFAAMEWRIGEVEDPADPDYDPLKRGKYEIDAIWKSGEIGYFNPAIIIPAPGLEAGHLYRVRVRHKDSTERWSHWSPPAQFRAGAPNNTVALIEHLSVSELMINPPGGSDLEFIELLNTSNQIALDLSGVEIKGGIDYMFPDGSMLVPGGHLLVVSASAADNFVTFRTYYGMASNVPILGPYDGKLSNSGEDVRIETAGGASVILAFTYDNSRGWPLAAQGGGHSMVPVASTIDATTNGSLNYGGNWRASTFIKGSPGQPDPLPSAGVVLNEFAAHTDYPLPPPQDSNDWIELLNTGPAAVTLGADWFLSDDVANLKKWAIDGTVLQPGGFAVFDEITDFHNPSGFGLDKTGEQLFLSHLPGTTADRIVDCVRFKAQESGATLGRYPDGTGYWHALVPTSATANVAPVRSIAINEIYYHSSDGSTNAEFIELLNPTDVAVELASPAGTWRLDGGVSFTFPAGTNIIAGERLLLVGFDPADAVALASFKIAHSLSETPVLVGPWDGNLSNGGERIALEKPEEPDIVTDPVAWVIVDEVIYFDRAPFSPEADGAGACLQRIAPAFSGNDPANWKAAFPSPSVLAIEAFRVSVQVANGTVNIHPGKQLYAAGEMVRLTALPVSRRYEFSHWTGDAPEEMKAQNPLTLTLDESKSLTAHFTKVLNLPEPVMWLIR